MRLTLWYLASFFVVLFVFGAGSYYAMQASILEEFDRDLKLRIVGIETFLDDQSQFGTEKLGHELQEHGQLRPGGELLQISDGSGNWLFASESMRHLGVRAPDKLPFSKTKITTVYSRAIPIRLATACHSAGERYFVIQLGQSLEESAELVQHFGWILVAGIPLVLLAASFSGYWMAGRALQPVSRITEDATAITALDISKRIAVPVADDELRKLSITLNQMMDRLEISFRKITQFTADASHELRTPISLIRTTAELAISDGSPQAGSEALLSILEESERTTSLLEDLLLLARSDSHVRLRVEFMDLVRVFNQAVAQTELLARNKDVELTCSVCDGPIIVAGNADLLRRLILILTDNAVKYTASGGHVYLSLYKDSSTAGIEVRDTGIGISSEDLPHIFERFYRADKARHRSGGAGLGLSIADWIARVHRARIGVSSTREAGTTFGVYVPLSQAHADISVLVDGRSAPSTGG
jgi:two-component system, OmpR family, heavy metal sensor histidine kinase CusS